MEKPPPPLPDPALVVKDTLRGIRFAVKKGGQLLASKNNPFVPAQVEDATHRLLSTAEQVSNDIGELAGAALGEPFARRDFPPADFWGLAKVSGEIPDITELAYALYRALSYTANRLGVENALVSEIVCSECLRQYAFGLTDEPDRKTEDKALLLFDLLCNRKVIGNPPGLSRAPDKGDQVSSVAAVFATVLWMFVPRNTNSENETEILEFCCEIADENSADIFTKQTEHEQMRALFKFFLNVV